MVSCGDVTTPVAAAFLGLTSAQFWGPSLASRFLVTLLWDREQEAGDEKVQEAGDEKG